MVDVGDKPMQLRMARARGFIRLKPETIELIRQNAIKKGDVLRIAEIAGILGAKQTASLIPLCHQISLSKIDVQASINETGVEVTTEAHYTGQTGVEMEALAAAGIALLTIYDMCKAVDREMVIGDISLVEKTKQEP